VVNQISVAFVGARGLGNYGGFETLAKELGIRLAGKGFNVLCSMEAGSSSNTEAMRHVETVVFPLRMPSHYALRHVFEVLYDWYFAFYFTFKRRCDVIYFLGTTISFLSFLPRVMGATSVVNMAGLEWLRSKFSSLQRGLIRLSLYFSFLGCDIMIVDNRRLADHISQKWASKIRYVSYGVEEVESEVWDPSGLPEVVASMLPRTYWLVVARIQPDNNIHAAIQGFLASHSAKPLVIVGDFSCPISYEKLLRDLVQNAPPGRILLTGAIYDSKKLNMLRQNAFGYVHPHSIGGTNPSLLEAMVMGNAIVANDNPFNREVAADTVLYYSDTVGLANGVDSMEIDSELRSRMGLVAHRRVLVHYSWENVAEEYADLIDHLLNRETRTKLQPGRAA
jgi:rhamnosyltransferase